MKKLFFMLCLNVLLFGEISVFDTTQGTVSNKFVLVNENNNSSKQHLNLTSEQLKNIQGTDEPTINIDDKSIYDYIKPIQSTINITQMPKSILPNQIFSFTLSAKADENLDLKLVSDINASKNFHLLNPNYEWSRLKNGLYSTVIWGAITNQDSNLSDENLSINLRFIRNGDLFTKAFATIPLPMLDTLEHVDNYSNIIADNLTIKKYKTSYFDDKNLIMIIDLNAINSSLSLIHVDNPNIIKQGIEGIKGSFSNQSGYYFAILPPNSRHFELTYYNIKQKQFLSYNLPIEIQNDDISTQSDLNPQNSSFMLYKIIALFVLIVIFLIYFVFKKSYISLIIAIILAIITIYIYSPYSDGFVKKGALIHILPTKQSTVFYIPNKNEKVKVMNKNIDGYTKILLKDNKIGWIKDEYLE